MLGTRSRLWLLSLSFLYWTLGQDYLRKQVDPQEDGGRAGNAGTWAISISPLPLIRTRTPGKVMCDHGRLRGTQGHGVFLQSSSSVSGLPQTVMGLKEEYHAKRSYLPTYSGFLHTWIAIQCLNDDPLTAAFICYYNYRQDHPLTLPQLQK